MTQAPLTARTFDTLAEADLEQVYQAGKDEVLRDRAFRILLTRAGSVEALEKLAFEGERGLAGWTTHELLEISNRFRLLSSPENEIRLYQQCQNEAFRRAPRVREFYVLALNRAGQPAHAIREASEIMASGGRSPIVWGALAQSYSALMLLAEQLAEHWAGPHSARLPISQAQLAAYFPEVDYDHLTLAQAQSLRQQSLQAATRIFRQGFSDTGMSYTGLGWMFRTIDQLRDLVTVRHQMARHQTTQQESSTSAIAIEDAIEEAVQRQRITDEIAALEHELACQTELIAIALELQGGSESLDYWTHIGKVQVAIVQAVAPEVLQPLLTRAVAAIDADFKFLITLPELKRMRDQFAVMRHSVCQIEHADGNDTGLLDARIRCAEMAIQALEAGRAQFNNGGTLPRHTAPAASTDPLAIFLQQTINFRALVGNLLPLYIEGTIGRVGARVPDLLINRRVQQDLVDLVEGKVLQTLPTEQRTDPRAVIARIQQVVGAGLNLGELQDLQSPAHTAFDVRSDGLIALSGVDFDLRKDSRTSTDLTAALLMQTGDCRETMYLNGALFATWQRMQVTQSIATAMLCLDLGYREGFDRIVRETVPALLRYQLRGGQAAVFVEGIHMKGKYQSVRRPADSGASADDAAVDDAAAMLRPYGLDELRAGQPLSRYELENSKIEVTYADASAPDGDLANDRVVWLEPRDPETGRWSPLAHVPVEDVPDAGGVPVLPDADPNFERVKSLRVLHLVEDHALTFLYDAAQNTVELCDGFYNEKLFNSPYAFGAGPLNLQDLRSPVRLIRAGRRSLVDSHGHRVDAPVYLSFLHFSKTDYAAGLLEGDMPDTLQLMGRVFRADLQRERRRLEEGTSPIPALLAKIQAWQLGRDASANEHFTSIDRQLTRLMLELAKEHPELVQLREVTDDQCLIREGAENGHIYLVLSGRLDIYRNGVPLRNGSGVPMVVAAGGVVGEITVLRGGLATATVQGNAVVLNITKAEIQHQLARRPALRRSMESVADYRIQVLTDNGYAVIDGL